MAHSNLKDARPSAHVAPEVKAFVDQLAAELTGPQFKRTKRMRAPSYARVEHVLFARAGLLPMPEGADAAALLEDIERAIAARQQEASHG